MADKSERSKDVEVEISLEEAKKLLQQKAKIDGEMSMKEIAQKLAPYDLESEEIFHFAEDLEKNAEIHIDGKDEFEEESIKEQANDEAFDLNDLSVPPGVKINDQYVCI